MLLYLDEKHIDVSPCSDRSELSISAIQSSAQGCSCPSPQYILEVRGTLDKPFPTTIPQLCSSASPPLNATRRATPRPEWAFQSPRRRLQGGCVKAPDADLQLQWSAQRQSQFIAILCPARPPVHHVMCSFFPSYSCKKSRPYGRGNSPHSRGDC